MSAGQLEQHVFSKTYFDPAGLILALEGARPIGFVHAGNGPNASGTDLDPTVGVICRWMALPHADKPVVMRELLDAAEHYLRQRGGREVRAGGVAGRGPFYLGFYGSATLPGVMVSDEEQLRLFRQAGYDPSAEVLVLQRSLVGFRPPVDRDQMKHRRIMETHFTHDPHSETWWEASTTACLERLIFALQPRVGGPPLLALKAWFMTPLCHAWGVRAVGLEPLQLPAAAWHDGTAMLLLADTMKLLLQEGVNLVEAVVGTEDTNVLGVLLALGFHEADRAVAMRKAL
jgi:hypothetical protein